MTCTPRLNLRTLIQVSKECSILAPALDIPVNQVMDNKVPKAMVSLLLLPSKVAMVNPPIHTVITRLLQHLGGEHELCKDAIYTRATSTGISSDGVRRTEVNDVG